MIIVIPTKNEERHILRAIKSAKNLSNEIYIFDSQSEDSTLDIAQELNVEVIQAPENIFFAEKMNFIYQYPRFANKYILRHDADEVISQKDAQIIKNAMIDPNTDCFTLSRKLGFAGFKLSFGGTTLPVLRLALQNSVIYENTPLDERILIKSEKKVQNLPAIIYDCPMLGFYDWIEKHNRYSEIESKLIFKTKKISSLNKPFKVKLYYMLPPIIRPFLYFFYRYVILLGFLDKKPGFIFHISHSLIYRLIIDVKLIILNLKQGNL